MSVSVFAFQQARHQEKGAHALAEEPEARDNGMLLHAEDKFLQLHEQLTANFPNVHWTVLGMFRGSQADVVELKQAIRKDLVPIKNKT